MKVAEVSCDRCKKPVILRTLSWFNEQDICLDCGGKEESHPQYQEAKQAENQAILNDVPDFEGIGLPEDLVVV